MDNNVMCGIFFLISILCYWQKLPWILEETERNQRRLGIMKRIKKWIYMGEGGEERWKLSMPLVSFISKWQLRCLNSFNKCWKFCTKKIRVNYKSIQYGLKWKSSNKRWLSSMFPWCTHFSFDAIFPQIFFETFNVPALFISMQAVLSL